MQLLYSTLLFLLFIVLLVAEFYVPSAGTVGAVALLAGLTSVAIAFSHSTFAGVGFSITVIVATPVILFWMVRHWPNTPIGKRILNRRPGQTEAPVESTLRSGEKRKDLVGRIGVAKTGLLPGGRIEIDDQRIDALSEGTPIEAGTKVVVISAIAGKIRVRPAGDGDLRQAAALNGDEVDNEGADSGAADVAQSTQAISHSLESLDLSELDEE